MGFFSSHAGNQSKFTVTTVIAQGCSVNGNFRLSSDMQVDGFVEGNIVSDKTLLISGTGRIKGDIRADKIIVNGLFEGNCHANSIEILPQGKVQGIIHCDDLSIERGGSFVGKTMAVSDDDVVKLASKTNEEMRLTENASA